ncbi:uncharacterized protein LOC111884055 [Lactuca sativa]|uniref:uncharacterized protein LOC111884055 n=1 Tax=Lactuca sativa TaxID=4236 RepID=UPI000CD8980C|nr:uncharacterized protein LOC111884055 [Lactuca sativa]
MVEYFNDQYAALTEVAVAASTTTIVAARVRGERALQYQEFNNTKPPVFNGVQDPIIAMSTLVELQEAARRQEIELELQKREQRQDPMQSQPKAKRFKAADVRFGSQRSCTCVKCGKVHEGSCRSLFGCHKYGKDGHYAKDCRQQEQAPALATFRITDGHHGMAEPSRARGRAFQLTVVEAKVAPNIVTGNGGWIKEKPEEDPEEVFKEEPEEYPEEEEIEEEEEIDEEELEEELEDEEDEEEPEEEPEVIHPPYIARVPANRFGYNGPEPH